MCMKESSSKLFIHLNTTIFVLLAPISAPQNVATTTITATAITICFVPPTGSSQNGIITSFNVSYTGSPFQTIQQVNTVSVSPTEYPLIRTVCTPLTNLEENNNYDISVLLTNSAGSGPASTDITALTLEAGEYFIIFCYLTLSLLFALSIVKHCLEINFSK